MFFIMDYPCPYQDEMVPCTCCDACLEEEEEE